MANERTGHLMVSSHVGFMDIRNHKFPKALPTQDGMLYASNFTDCITLFLEHNSANTAIWRQMWLLLLLVVGAAAQDSMERRLKLCGRELARAHSLYCYGLDPVPQESIDSNHAKIPGFESNDVDHPKIPERFVHKLRRAAERPDLASRLVEACCHKPCHINELLKNC